VFGDYSHYLQEVKSYK